MAAESLSHPGRVVARLARQVELGAATAELTLAQYRVLGTLDDGREAASVLADKLAVSRPSVTGVIDGLVARGLVRRDPDELDRRRIDLGLTADGRRALAQADAEVERRLGEIAAHAQTGAAHAQTGAAHAEPGAAHAEPGAAHADPGAAHADPGAGDPFAGLGAWRAALDAQRAARHAGRMAASAG